jgi:signal transduction histidine kinase
MIQISITDNGHGIAQVDIHHIFKGFYRCKTFLENINRKQALAFGLWAKGRRFFISSGNFAE